jgi:TPP-dependent pyruvate/acetoin dehydrogenase alpha subunit
VARKRKGFATMPSSGPATGNNHAMLLRFYEQLCRIRRCEERLQRLFAEGEVPGFIHLSIGQEAISVGVMSALDPEDTIASTHRGHGHALAKGMPLDGFFAELLARDTGVCRGRGGSMHVADMSIGMLGANGIVGAGLSIATGSALAHKLKRTGAIAVSFFGDGALAEGLLHECGNVAALMKLPILFVCEANGWSEFSPTNRQIAFDLGEWSKAFGIPYRKADGNDVLAVADAAETLIAGVRSGQGPALLECSTSRWRGHFEGDAQKYRPQDEARGRDPLVVAAQYLAAECIGEEDLERIAARIDAEVEAAIEAARAAAPASYKSGLADVYTRETV